MLRGGTMKVGHGRKLRKPKIRHLGVVALVEKNVTGFDVPVEYGRVRFRVQVDDAPRRPQRYVQSSGKVQNLRGCNTDRDRQEFQVTK